MSRKWAHITHYINAQGERTQVRLYGVWRCLIQRCTNPKFREFPYYGGRGITVCDEWLSYDNFYEWAYSTGYDDTAPRGVCTLDRIDVNGNYTPSNCRWVSMKIQNRNKVNNVLVEGRYVVDAVASTGLSRSALEYRRAKNKFITYAELTKSRKVVCVDGKPLKKIAENLGVNYKTLWARYKANPNSTYAELAKPIRKKTRRGLC